MSGPSANLLVPAAGLSLAALVAGAGLFLVGRHNALVVLRNRYKNAFAQFEVHLNRRLAELSDASADNGLLERASRAAQRAAANPGDPDSIHALSQAVADLRQAGEPLKLSDGGTDPMDRALRIYNSAAADYNAKRRSPLSLPVALLSGFGPSATLERLLPT